MEIKKVLAEINAIDKKIKILEDEIRLLKSSCIPGGISYDWDRVQTSPTADKMGEIFSRIEEITDELTFTMMEAINRKASLIERINRIPDMDEAMSLYYRYCENVRYEDLGDYIGLSQRQTARILKRAEQHFKNLPETSETGDAVFLGEGDRDEYYDDMIMNVKMA